MLKILGELVFKTYKTYNLFICLACATIIGAGFFIEYFFLLLPCPLCILQRICYIATAAVALIALMHNPKNVGKFLYLILSQAFVLLGLIFVVTQIWLQYHPSQSEQLCMAGFFNLLSSYSLMELSKIIFSGSTTCIDSGFRILWLTIAEWSLVAFSLLLIVNFFALIFTKNRRWG